MHTNLKHILLGTLSAAMLCSTPALADCVVTKQDGKTTFVTGTCSENFAQAPQPTRVNPYQPTYYGYNTSPYYTRYRLQPDYYRHSVDDNVAAIQTKLIRLGYWVGPEGVNGVRGSDTIQAIKDFQKQHGLKVDGVVGPQTAYKLNERTANFDYSNRWVRYPDYASGDYR